jgi:integrase
MSTQVLLYLGSMLEAGLKLSTMNRAVVSLALAQAAAGAAPFRNELVVKEFLKGLRRRLRGVRRREAPPIMLEDLRRLVAATQSSSSTSRQGIRDRAMLLVGFWGALRRSELVALDVGDVRLVGDGVRLEVRSSKTDQEGAGAVLGLPRRSDELCPAAAVRQWLALRHDEVIETSGDVDAAVDDDAPLFVSFSRRNPGARLAPQAVERILRRAVAAAGVDGGGKFTPHSLRAGFATSAARAGKPAHAIRRQTRHASLAMLERYIREGDLFSTNAATDM